MAEVATTKLFENDKIILWEMVLEPGQSTGMHTHKRDYIVHIMEGATLDVFGAKGELLFNTHLESGITRAHRIEGKDIVVGDDRIPATHDAKNVDNCRFREILIEMK